METWLVSTSFRGIRLSHSRGWLYLLLCAFSLSRVIFHGQRGRCSRHGHVQTNPHGIPLSWTTPSRMTWLQQQPIILDSLFGLLKDVMLSVLPFKAGSMYNLSGPLGNNAEDHYTYMQGHNPSFSASTQFKQRWATLLIQWWEYCWSGPWIWLKRKFISHLKKD